MKATIKNQWIENLRSGRFAQGAGRLRSPENQYCCLGVLAETLIENGYPIHWKEYKGYVAVDGQAACQLVIEGDEETHTAYLGSQLVYDIGLGHSAEMTLSSMNDSQAKSFSEIADWIQENIPVDPEPADSESQ